MHETLSHLNLQAPDNNRLLPSPTTNGNGSEAQNIAVRQPELTVQPEQANLNKELVVAVTARLQELIANIEAGQISDPTQLRLLGLVTDVVREEHHLSPSEHALPELAITTVEQASQEVSNWRLLRKITGQVLSQKIRRGTAVAIAKFNELRARGFGTVLTEEYLKFEDELRALGRDTVTASQSAINNTAQAVEAAQRWQRQQEENAQRQQAERSARDAADRQQLSGSAPTPEEQRKTDELVEIHRVHNSRVATPAPTPPAPDTRTVGQRFAQPLEAGAAGVGSQLTKVIERAQQWQQRQEENGRLAQQQKAEKEAARQQQLVTTTGEASSQAPTALDAQPSQSQVDATVEEAQDTQQPAQNEKQTSQSTVPDARPVLEQATTPVATKLEAGAQKTATLATRMIDRARAWQQQQEAIGRAREQQKLARDEEKRRAKLNTTPVTPTPAPLEEPAIEPKYVASTNELRPIKVRKSDKKILAQPDSQPSATDTRPVLEQAAQPVLQPLERWAQKLGNFANKTGDNLRVDRAALAAEKKRQAELERLQTLQSIDASAAENIINGLSEHNLLSKTNIDLVVGRNTPQLTPEARQALLEETRNLYTDMQLNLGATELANQFAHQFINEPRFEFSTDAVRKVWDKLQVLGDPNLIRQMALTLLREDRQFIATNQEQITAMIDQLLQENQGAVTTQRVRELIEAGQFAYEAEHRQRALEAHILRQAKANAEALNPRVEKKEVNQQQSPMSIVFGGLRRFNMPGRKKAA